MTKFTIHNCSSTVHGTYNHVIQKKNIKNGSYGTIYTFKNYFTTVFLVFSFNKNKFNLNGPLVTIFFQGGESPMVTTQQLLNLL